MHYLGSASRVHWLCYLGALNLSLLTSIKCTVRGTLHLINGNWVLRGKMLPPLVCCLIIFTVTFHTERVKRSLIKCKPGSVMLLQLPPAAGITSKFLGVAQEPSVSWPLPPLQTSLSLGVLSSHLELLIMS